jgi:predicted metal-dependent hydrolase
MDIKYSLKRSRKRKKTISLQIGNNSEITIYAPYFTPVTEINRFVEEKQNWIDRAMRRQAKLQVGHEEKTYVTGENFYYLGQNYPLEAYFEPLENAGVIFWNNRFFLNCPPNPEMRKNYFVSWYKKKARQYLLERVDFYESMFKLKSSGIRITSAESRWGSCSEDNHLSFSFRLMMAPPEIVDYVVVHEMMHIREKNHSSKFWNLVVEVIPDFKAHRRWLRDHQHLFNL